MFPRNVSSQKRTNAREHVERTNTLGISLTETNLDTQELILQKSQGQTNVRHEESWVAFNIGARWVEGVKLSDLSGLHQWDCPTVPSNDQQLKQSGRACRMWDPAWERPG